MAKDFDSNWAQYTHPEVEEVIKEKVAELEDRIDESALPEGGIPKSELSSEVQTSLGKADTALQQHQDISHLATKTELAGKVDKNGTDSLMTAAEHTKLGNLPTATELATQMNAKANDNAVVKTISVNGGTPATPVNGNVDISVEGGETQVVSVDDVAILDGFTHNTILAAASARSVMLLKDNVDTLYSKLNDLFDKLAGIAFTNDKPTSSWKPAWSAAAFPTHTITVGTLTDVTVYYDGTAKAAGSTITADEGEVTLKLTPASNTMLLASGISIKKSGNIDVDFTTTAGTGADAGSTLVTFVLGADVTFSAASSSGIAVQLAGTNSGNVTQSVNGVPLSGDNRAIVLSHAEHYSWDGNTITLSVTGIGDLTENTDYTITDNQDGTKTVTILKEFTSDTYPIIINVGAVEDDHAVLDITNVGSNVTIKRSGSTLAGGAHLYQGDRIDIVPESGFSVSASATSGGNAVTLSGDAYNGYYYTLGSGDVSSGGMTFSIIASASTINTYNISNNLFGITNSNNATTINEGQQYSATLDVDNFHFPFGTYGANNGDKEVLSVTMGGVAQTVTPSADGKSVTINIQQVTGDIVITAGVVSMIAWNKGYRDGGMVDTSSDNGVAEHYNGHICALLAYIEKPINISTYSWYPGVPSNDNENDNCLSVNERKSDYTYSDHWMYKKAVITKTPKSTTYYFNGSFYHNNGVIGQLDNNDENTAYIKATIDNTEVTLWDGTNGLNPNYSWVAALAPENLPPETLPSNGNA